MSSPLDRIPGKPPYRIAGIPPGIISSDDYDVTDEALSFLARHEALVKVARAAETVWTSIGHAAWCGSIEGEPCDCGQTALREALAALNKEPA